MPSLSARVQQTRPIRPSALNKANLFALHSFLSNRRDSDGGSSYIDVLWWMGKNVLANGEMLLAIPILSDSTFPAHLLDCIATRTLRNFDLPDSIQTNGCVISLIPSPFLGDSTLFLSLLSTGPQPPRHHVLSQKFVSSILLLRKAEKSSPLLAQQHGASAPCPYALLPFHYHPCFLRNSVTFLSAVLPWLGKCYVKTVTFIRMEDTKQKCYLKWENSALCIVEDRRWW